MVLGSGGGAAAAAGGAGGANPAGAGAGAGASTGSGGWAAGALTSPSAVSTPSVQQHRLTFSRDSVANTPLSRDRPSDWAGLPQQPSEALSSITAQSQMLMEMLSSSPRTEAGGNWAGGGSGRDSSSDGSSAWPGTKGQAGAGFEDEGLGGSGGAAGSYDERSASRMAASVPSPAAGGALQAVSHLSLLHGSVRPQAHALFKGSTKGSTIGAGFRSFVAKKGGSR